LSRGLGDEYNRQLLSLVVPFLVPICFRLG